MCVMLICYAYYLLSNSKPKNCSNIKHVCGLCKEVYTLFITCRNLTSLMRSKFTWLYNHACLLGKQSISKVVMMLLKL